MGTHSNKSQDKEEQPCQENSPKSRPRPVASPLPRLAPVLLNLITSTAVSTLEIGIATRTLETLILLPLSTPPVSVLVAALMDSVFPPESPRSSVLLLLEWSVTGPKAVESSTTLPRPSFSGSTKRIR